MKWVPLKRLCVGPPQYGLNTPASAYSDTGVRFLRTTDIGSDGSVADDGAVYVDAALVDDTYRLAEGDLLFSRSGTLGRHLRYRQSMGEATFAGYLIRFRPASGVSSAFLVYCAQARFFEEAIEANAVSSTISNFNAERYAHLHVPSWSSRMQRGIVDFLDVETTRIDALIAKKRRMIELLAEGFESWLDRLVREAVGPASSWVPLRYVARVGGGLTLGSQFSPPLVTRPYLRVANVQDGLLDLDDVATVDVPEEIAARFELRYGDVLMLEGNGNPDNLGRGTMWRNEVPQCLHQNHVHAVRADREALEPEYLDLVVRTARARSDLTGGIGQVSIATLSKSQILDLRVPLPPLKRQRELATEAHRLKDAGRAVSSQLGRQIDLLTERRQALITAAVTGELEIARSMAEEASLPRRSIN